MTVGAEEFFDDQFDIDVTQSSGQFVQIECPHCGGVLGHLGVAGAFGSPNYGGMFG